MKYLLMMAVCLLTHFSFAQTAVVTTVYLLRHAEKADTSANPDLSEAGIQRARKLVSMFETIPIDLFFSTPYKRTQQTISAVADSKQKEITTYKPADMDLRKLIAQNPGKTILIVGHSNTIPKYINTLLDKKTYQDIPESEFDHLYTIRVLGAQVSCELTKI